MRVASISVRRDIRWAEGPSAARAFVRKHGLLRWPVTRSERNTVAAYATLFCIARVVFDAFLWDVSVGLHTVLGGLTAGLLWAAGAVIAQRLLESQRRLRNEPGDR